MHKPRRWRKRLRPRPTRKLSLDIAAFRNRYDEALAVVPRLKKADPQAFTADIAGVAHYYRKEYEQAEQHLTLLGLVGLIRVGTHVELPDVIGPAHELVEQLEGRCVFGFVLLGHASCLTQLAPLKTMQQKLPTSGAPLPGAGGLFQAVFLQLAIERAFADAEHLRRLLA